MAIRKYIWMFSLVLVVFSCERIERPSYSNELGQFVRFNLQVNSGGELLEAGVIRGSSTVTEYYEQKSVRTLAIPVAITSEPLDAEVQVYFSYDTIGSYSDFTIYPEGVLTFSGNDLNDTIYVDYMSRWEAGVENRIVFKLDSVSNDSIQIGSLNDIAKNDILELSLTDLTLKYNFPLANAVEILGELGEEVFIKVEFPDGFFPDEIEGVDLLVPGLDEFAYSVELLPYTEEDLYLIYYLVLEEAINADSLTFTVSFDLKDLDAYELAGYSTFSIVKPENIPRDVSLNTAGNFYDLSDALYRTYGELWIDYSQDGNCVWRSFSQFTYPVEVLASHPNAVLYDNKGTADPNDDIYHHAFRIGFNTPNFGRTTNSFYLKGWFDNEYTDADKSPGFNITQALEFYPDNEGTSATGGIVRVIPQDIIITGKNGDGTYNTHTIAIEGEGEYIEISGGVFELTFELRATNEDLFGGTQTGYYVLYNIKDYGDEPLPLEDGCVVPISL